MSGGATKVQPQQKEAKAAGQTAPKPAAVKSSPAKGGKKSAKGSGAGQKSLMSFFSKK